MSLNYAFNKIREEDYLQGELRAEFKHEYIDGEVYAMAGASEYHNLLSTNILTEFKNQLKGKPCKVFMADMKVKTKQCFFYPDVMVVCQTDNEHAYYKTLPVIIVEVLAKSTRRFDQMIKRLHYQNITTLEEYVLIEQDKGEIQVFSRKDAWQPSFYYLGDEITFYSLAVTVRVEDIYYQVNNEDVLAFLHDQGYQA